MLINELSVNLTSLTLIMDPALASIPPLLLLLAFCLNNQKNDKTFGKTLLFQIIQLYPTAEIHRYQTYSRPIYMYKIYRPAF